MKIIIIGCGKVGYTIAERLTLENHDITVIDTNAAVLSDAKESLDIMAVVGNGAALDTLKKAGAEKSDIVISTTNADETNLLACISAKKLGTAHTIARVRNPQYTKQVKFLKNELGLSLAVNPDLSAAHEMYRIIQLPSFLKRDAFAKGRVELVEIKVAEDGKLANKALYDIASSLPVRILICAVEREGEVIIPNGNFVIKAGDKITVTAARNDLAPLIKSLGIISKKIKSVTLIGCSRIAEYLTEELEESGIAVKVIEKDAARCEEFALRFPKALVINGNASKRGFLESVGVESSDAVVTLTGIDEENIITSMFCTSIGVPKTVTKIDRTEYLRLFADSKLDSVISPKDLTTSEIVRYIRSLDDRCEEGTMRALHHIVDKKAEAIEFAVTNPAPYLDVPLKDLKRKPNTLICCISRGSQVIIPRGDDEIKLGDSVIIVTTAEQTLNNLSEIFVRDTERQI